MYDFNSGKGKKSRMVIAIIAIVLVVAMIAGTVVAAIAGA